MHFTPQTLFAIHSKMNSLEAYKVLTKVENGKVVKKGLERAGGFSGLCWVFRSNIWFVWYNLRFEEIWREKESFKRKLSLSVFSSLFFEYTLSSTKKETILRSKRKYWKREGIKRKEWLSLLSFLFSLLFSLSHIFSQYLFKPRNIFKIPALKTFMPQTLLQISPFHRPYFNLFF